MLTKTEHARLRGLPQHEKNTAIRDACNVIYRSVNSGTVDRDTVNAALERIAACVEKTTQRSTDGGAPVLSPKPLGTPAHTG